MKREVIITFNSTHDALAAQRVLKDASLSFRVIPTPVEITSDCGIALLVPVSIAPACSNLRGANRTLVLFYGNRLEILGPYID